jgi:uncharacterized membrane protein
MIRRPSVIGLVGLFVAAGVALGNSHDSIAATCSNLKVSNAKFEIVADVQVLSVDGSGTAAIVSLTKQVKGKVPLKTFGIYSYLPTPLVDVDSPEIPPSNTLTMQAGTGLRIRGRWDTNLLPIGQTPARMQIDFCSTQPISLPGPFEVTVASNMVRVNAGNDATIRATAKLLSGASLNPDVNLILSGAPKGVALLSSTEVNIVNLKKITGRTTDFVLSTTTETEPGVYELRLVSTSGKITRTLPIALRVTRHLPGFAIAVQPLSSTVAAGYATSQASSFTIELTNIGGMTYPVSFSVTGLPKEATATIANSVAGATIQVTTTTKTPPGTYELLIIARGGPRTATVAVTLVVVAELLA